MTTDNETQGLDHIKDWATDYTTGHGLPDPHELPSIFIRQKVTPITNKYWIHKSNESGDAGEVLAFAEQKKFKLKEEIDFFTDDSKTTKVFALKSRQVIDLAATSDVFDRDGNTIGIFRKDATASLFNSTWHLRCPEFVATGRERSQGMATTRRFVGLVPVVGELLDAMPWQFHFDFYTPDETLVMSDERQLRIRDHYLITLPEIADGKPMDWRVAAALGVALDAFQGR